MKKAEAIKILKNRFTWVIIASALAAIGVTVPAETLNGIAQVVITAVEALK